jgi:hypothetical protein
MEKLSRWHAKSAFDLTEALRVRASIRSMGGIPLCSNVPIVLGV